MRTGALAVLLACAVCSSGCATYFVWAVTADLDAPRREFREPDEGERTVRIAGSFVGEAARDGTRSRRFLFSAALGGDEARTVEILIDEDERSDGFPASVRETKERATEVSPAILILTGSDPLELPSVAGLTTETLFLEVFDAGIYPHFDGSWLPVRKDRREWDLRPLEVDVELPFDERHWLPRALLRLLYVPAVAFDIVTSPVQLLLVVIADGF